MKTIHIIILFTVTALLGSCTLEREDYSQLDSSLFFKTESDCQSALNALYAIIGTEGGHGGPIYGSDVRGFTFAELATDILTSDRNFKGFEEHKYSPVSDPSEVIAKKFGLVNAITRCRATVLRIKATNIPEAAKNRMIAEATMIRAFIMIHLYGYFGPVPVVSDESIMNPQNKEYFARLSRTDYVKLVQDEIDAALPFLGDPKNQSYNADAGRMNKGIAYTCLMKMYMIDKNWAKVKEYAQKVIDLKCYELESGCLDVFKLANRGNKEVIYARPSDANIPLNGNTWHAQYLPGIYNIVPEGAYSNRWGMFYIRWDYLKTFSPNDKRLKEGIVSSFTDKNGKDYPERSFYGAICLKYDLDPTGYVGNMSGHDIVVLRYADILLSMAEALNELEGPTEEAYGYFDKIRPRTGLANLTSGLSKEQFRDSILMERGHEFFCEGHRYIDLVRHNKLVEYARKNENDEIQDGQALLPIPDGKILEYGGVLEQNFPWGTFK